MCGMGSQPATFLQLMSPTLAESRDGSHSLSARALVRTALEGPWGAGGTDNRDWSALRGLVVTWTPLRSDAALGRRSGLACAAGQRVLLGSGHRRPGAHLASLREAESLQVTKASESAASGIGT